MRVLLKTLRLSNFKPFPATRSQAIRLAPITLIYGPNSSGKSSIIQALLMMKQSADSFRKAFGRPDLLTAGSEVDLGSMGSVLHKHTKSKPLKVGFTFQRDGADCSGITETNIDLDFSISNDNREQAAMYPARLQKLCLSAHLATTTPACTATLTLKRLDESSIGDKLTSPDQYEGAGFSYRNLWTAGVYKVSTSENLNFLLSSIVSGLSSQLSNSNSDTYATARQAELLETAKFFRSQKFVRELDSRFLSEFTCHAQGHYLPHPLFDDAELDKFGKRISTRDGKKKRGSLSYSAMAYPATYECTEISRLFDRDFTAFMRGITYLGPLRMAPQRYYTINDQSVSSVGSRGESAITYLYKDSLRGVDSRKMVDELNFYCKKFEIPYEISLHQASFKHEFISSPVVSLVLRDRRTGVDVAPTDVGFGVSQILPILVEGIGRSKHSLKGAASKLKSSSTKLISSIASRTICVEQPEIHLHPRLQAELADFFVDTAVPANGRLKRRGTLRPVQWIIETHSELLMLRLQKRIRQGRLRKEDISVVYVEPKGRFGSDIKELRLDDDGEFLDLWPSGFFVESMSEAD